VWFAASDSPAHPTTRGNVTGLRGKMVVLLFELEAQFLTTLLRVSNLFQSCVCRRNQHGMDDTKGLISTFFTCQ